MFTPDAAGRFQRAIRTDLGGFYDYGGGHTRLWVYRADSSGQFSGSIRWDSGPGAAP